MLTSLFEAPGLVSAVLPPGLSALHGGGLGFSGPTVFANFVVSLDGVTAIAPRSPGQGRLISGGLPADRFMMGLLRAFADAVLIGAGTLRAESEHVWTPESVFPAGAADFAQLRRKLGLARLPRLAVVTASGDLDLMLPALRGGLVITSAATADRLRRQAPPDVALVAAGEGTDLSPGEIRNALRQAGLHSILTEGGPHLFGGLLAAGMIDELFLTLSPVLAGRSGGAELGLVEGAALLPKAGVWGRLLSLHLSGSHIFLRYDLRADRQGGA